MDKWYDPSVIIAGVSALIAIFALVMSMLSYRVSKKSLSISSQSYARSIPNVSIVLNEAFSKLGSDDKYKYFCFFITATNKSTQSNSLIRIEMNVLYSKAEGFLSNIILSHNPDKDSELDMPNLSILPNTVFLEGGGAKSGWIVFKVSNDFLKNKNIRGYKVLFKDVNNNYVELEPIIIKEIHDSDEVEKESHSD